MKKKKESKEWNDLSIAEKIEKLNHLALDFWKSILAPIERMLQDEEFKKNLEKEEEEEEEELERMSKYLTQTGLDLIGMSFNIKALRSMLSKQIKKEQEENGDD